VVIALYATHSLARLELLVVEEDAVVREAEARWAGHVEGKVVRMTLGRMACAGTGSSVSCAASSGDSWRDWL